MPPRARTVKGLRIHPDPKQQEMVVNLARMMGCQPDYWVVYEKLHTDGIPAHHVFNAPVIDLKGNQVS